MSTSVGIGLTGLVAAQQALGVAGQNIANAATPDYGRRQVLLGVSANGVSNDGGIGSGTEVLSVVRTKDSLLSARLLSQRGLLERYEVENSSLRQVESVMREPSANGLNAGLAEFFNSWQSLAGNPESAGERSLVVQESDHMALMLRTMREELVQLRNDVRRDMEENLSRVNDITERIAETNGQILQVAATGGSPLDLLDRRDQLLGDMFGLVGGNAVFSQNGTVRVSVGSALIVEGVRQVEFELTDGENAEIVIAGTEGGLPVTVTNGRIGGLQSLYDTVIPEHIDRLDVLAAALIGEANKIHAEGLGQGGRMTSVSGAWSVSDTDGDGDASNDMLADAGLSFEPTAGTLRINVADNGAGTTTAATLNFDPAAQSLADLAAAISGIDHVSATAGGDRLNIFAESGYSFDFCADQETNVLAALGINALFHGEDASDIEVNSEIMSDPSKLAAGQSLYSGDGSNAAALAELRGTRVLENDTRSLMEYWQITAAEVGGASSRSQRQMESQQDLVSMLEAQQESASGVSLDEEATNLLRYQQMYRSCAHFVQVSSKLVESLLQYV